QKFLEETDQQNKSVRFDLKWNRINQARITTPLETKFEDLIKSRQIENKLFVKEMKVKPLPMKNMNSSAQRVKLQHTNTTNINLQTKLPANNEITVNQVKPLLSKRIDLIHSLNKNDLLIQQQT